MTNYGLVYDSAIQDLTVSVILENALSGSEVSFLEYVVYNACFGALWASSFSNKEFSDMGGTTQ